MQKLIHAMVKSLLYHELKNLYKDPLTSLGTKNALIKDMVDSENSRMVIIGIDDFPSISNMFGDKVSSQVIVKLAQYLKKNFSDEFSLSSGCRYFCSFRQKYRYK